MNSKPKTKEKSKFLRDYEKRHAIVDAILLAYEKHILYDYPIPNAHEVCSLVKMYLEKTDKKLPEKFKNKIREAIWAAKDEYSNLEDYLRHHENKFGHEWFYGYGTLHRWRPGQREEAEKRVKKHLTSTEQKHLPHLHDHIRITNKAKAFEPMETKVGKI